MATPTGTGVWLRELDSERGQLTLDKAIPKLRDEVLAVSMDRHRGQSRELALVVTKLEEAYHWALTYLEKTGAMVIVPRAEILQKAATVTTHTTLTKEGSEND